MRSVQHVVAQPVPSRPPDNASVAERAEAWLATLPEVGDDDVRTLLTDGMVLVSGLLCGDANGTPAQERHRKLASLVLAKMQRITRETSMGRRQGTYPCFTS